MQLKNLSVSKKIWLLVCSIMGLLAAASFVMVSYLQSVENAARQDIAAMEKRVEMAVQLRNGFELGASYISTANLAEDADSQRFFNDRFRALQKENAQLLQRFGESVESQHGKEAFAKMLAHLGRADPLIDHMERERANGNNVEHMVRNELLPLVGGFSSQLNDMVKMQQQLHDDKLAQADAQRERALTLGIACWVLVITVALLVSAGLVRQLTQPLAQAVQLADAIAAGDLSRSVEDDRLDELGQLMHSLNAMSAKLRAMVSDIRQGVDSVSSAASQIATGNQDLSARTEQTAANLEETASSLEELTATVTQSADTANQAKQLAVTAVKAAEQGGEVVNQVVMSMDQINTSSRKISDIIGVIDGIAFQTNILALNAAVEAARAGEQGRGFAVVAGEVRSLAGRSAEAAKEIKALITASVSSVEVGAQQVSEAGQSMQEIVDSVRRVTDLIGEITASSSEQRDGISQVNQAVSNLDQMTQQNAALVEESSSAAVSMNEQAQRLAQIVGVFNVGHTLSSAVAATGKRTSALLPSAGAAAKQAVQQPRSSASAHASTPKAGTVSSAPKLLRPEPLTSKANSHSEDDWETF